MSIIAGKIKGITITLGADVQPLNKALEDVNKKSRDLQAELRQVERLLKLDPSNTTLLAQKQKLLAEAVENSREKLNRLKTAQEQVNEQFRKGEINEEQYRAFQREVVKAEQELAKFEKQLRETGMTAEQVGKKLQDAGQKLTDVGKKMSTYVTAPIVAAGAASFKMAADLQDAMGATDQIFKGAADSVKTWADNLESYYGIAEGEALEYANMMGSMLQNIGGLTEDQAAKQAQTLIELAGDLTAMYGGTTADAVRALTGALKGNNTMLDNYGMAANDAMIKTKALEMGIYDGKGQMELATKQAATLALIMEQTGAAQGQAAREAEGASGGMRAFATEIKNIATDIGEVLLPVITPLLNRLGEIVKKFSELSPETQKIIVAIAGVAAAIGPLLMILGPLISAIGTLITGLGAMSTAMAGGASIVAGLTAGFPALGAAITLLTGPIGIAIAAIAAITAAIIYLWNTNEEFREGVIVVWEQIKEAFRVALDYIQELITAVVSWLTAFWQANGEAIKNFTKLIWDTIANTIKAVLTIISGLLDVFIGLFTGDWERFGEGLKKIWEGLWDGIAGIVKGAWDLLKTAFNLLWDKISGWFKDLVADAKQWGKDIISGMIEGIKSMIDKVKNAVSSVVSTVTGGVKSALKISSPSRVMVDLGEHTGEGFLIGLTSVIGDIENQIGRLAPSTAPSSSAVPAARLTIINHGTVVGRGGMEEFADIISRSLAGKYGLGTGGVY